MIEPSRAIRNHSDLGPVFSGDGSGIYIYDECNLMENSYYAFNGTTFKKASGSASLLAEKTHFKVLEIEVFSLI